MNKRKSEENNSIETISTKSNRRSLKKNLGKERMEKLRESLSVKSDDNLNESICSSTNSSIDLCGKYYNILLIFQFFIVNFLNNPIGKLPNIYKNAEVRLVRLKERFLNDKTFINKNLCTDKDKEVGNSSTESITTINDLIKRSNENSFYEEMDWEPLEDEKIMFEVILYILINRNFTQIFFFYINVFMINNRFTNRNMKLNKNKYFLLIN